MEESAKMKQEATNGCAQAQSADRDKLVAAEIKAGRCPFGMLRDGQTIAHCLLGFPGCECGDELMLNPYLQVGEGKGKECNDA